MTLTSDIVLKKIQEVARKHLKPNPVIGIDSLALGLNTTVHELNNYLSELEFLGKIEIIDYAKTPSSNRLTVAGAVKLAEESPASGS